MTRECIHGKPFHTCDICKHVKNLLNHNTVVGTKAHIIDVGIRSSNFKRSMNLVRVSKLSDFNATRRVIITPTMRNSANAYIMNPSTRTAGILREDLSAAMTPRIRLLNLSVSDRKTTTPVRRISRSALSVYGRMGTPASPVSKVRPRSPSNANKNNASRNSSPESKRSRKSK